MGAMIAKALGVMVCQQETRILMLGLDAAGKTTVLYKMKLGEIVNTIPTIGFNVETLQYKNISFTMWDVGGQDRIRPLWRHYFHGTQGLIFVVDSNDSDRLGEASDELHRLLAEPELEDACVCEHTWRLPAPATIPLAPPSTVCIKTIRQVASH